MSDKKKPRRGGARLDPDQPSPKPLDALKENLRALRESWKEKRRTRREARKARPPRTRKQKLRLAVIIVLVVLLALILAVLIAWKLLFVRPTLPSDNPEPSTSSETDAPEETEVIDYGEGIRPRTSGERKSEDYYTVLILGVDTSSEKTDTMMLASYDVTNQKATVMSIPRDTMVNVPWDIKKINSVYGWYGGGEKGLKYLYQEISQLVGFEPDYQIVVEWEAVGELVDAIGGVWYDVPYDMDYDDPLQDLYIHQEKGYRLLDGDDAMQVIRWRKNNNGSLQLGDVQRIQFQQDFLMAVVEQLLQIDNITRVGEIATVFQKNVTTDLSFQNILWFAQQAILGGLTSEDVEFVTMPYTAPYCYSRTVGNMQSYVTPIADELLELVNTKLSPYVEEFTYSDLDLMSVNADGSVSSSTGHVEDTQATYPKSHWFPAETTPVETAPAETEPVETEPTETGPAETGPVETSPTETTPVETPPVETAPVETGPVETTPVETTPVETIPVESPPAETDPASSPSQPAASSDPSATGQQPGVVPLPEG